MDDRLSNYQITIISALHDDCWTASEIRDNYLPDLTCARSGELCRRLARMGLIYQDAETGRYTLTEQGARVETIAVQQVRYVACHAVERRQETIHLRSTAGAGPPITLCGMAVRVTMPVSSDPKIHHLGKPRDLPYLQPYTWGCDSDWCPDCTNRAQKMGLIPGREAMSE